MAAAQGKVKAAATLGLDAGSHAPRPIVYLTLYSSAIYKVRVHFSDRGVRNSAAELALETTAVRANPGPLFEQWVGTKLL